MIVMPGGGGGGGGGLGGGLGGLGGGGGWEGAGEDLREQHSSVHIRMSGHKFSSAVVAQTREIIMHIDPVNILGTV